MTAMNTRYSEIAVADIAAVKASNLFDEAWYLDSYHDVGILNMDPAHHFLWVGAQLGRSPSPHFDVKAYLNEYQDVYESKMNPLLHYIRRGKREGRIAFPLQRAASAKLIVGEDSILNKIAAARKLLLRKENTPIVLYESHNLKMQGAPNSLMEIACGITRRGRYQSIMTCNTPGPLSDLYNQQGISHIIHSISQNRMKSADERETWLSRLSEIYAAINPSIVHVNTLQNFHAVLAAKKAGYPVVWNVRESEEPSTYYDYLPEDARALAYSAFDKADTVIFVANSTRKLWEKFWKKPTKTVTIYNGINMDRLMFPIYGTNRSSLRASYGLDENDVMVLSVGTVSERKGQMDLPRAFELLSPQLLSQTVAAIVGFNESNYSKEVLERLNSLKSRGLRVVAIEETQGEDDRRSLSELYLCADIFAFCSRMESYPRVIMEALEFGLPIISTPCFGVQEQLEDQISGLFYGEGQIDVFASQLIKLIEDRSMRNMMSIAAATRLKRLNSYQQMIETYERIYDSFLLSA